MPTFIDKTGAKGFRPGVKAKAMLLGGYYYLSGKPGYMSDGQPWYSTYPLGRTSNKTWGESDESLFAPVSDVSDKAHWVRDACGVLCIRK